jgi:hypothetical protein
MIAREIVTWLEERGITLRVKEDGTLGAKQDGRHSRERFAAIIDKVKARRDDLLAFFHWRDRPVADPVHECQWATGHVSPHSFPEQGWPTGATHYRLLGEEAWTEIPADARDRDHRRRMDAIRAQRSADPGSLGGLEKDRTKRPTARERKDGTARILYGS